MCLRNGPRYESIMVSTTVLMESPVGLYQLYSLDLQRHNINSIQSDGKAFSEADKTDGVQKVPNEVIH
jgi:hypothetical protein